MNRQQLIDRLIELDDIESKASANRILDHLTDTITETIKSGEEVYLGQSFGGFKPATQSARSGKTALGAVYSTPAKTVIKFKPSTKLKEWIA